MKLPPLSPEKNINQKSRLSINYDCEEVFNHNSAKIINMVKVEQEDDKEESIY